MISLAISRRLVSFQTSSRSFFTRCYPLLTNVRDPSFSDPYSLDIPTVELSFEKHPGKTSNEISKLETANKPVPADLQKAAKEPILVLHGLFGSKTNTRSVSRALARDTDRDVYCVDLRNHGDSPHSPVHTYPALAADVEAFIAQHALGPSIIVGHSMGAKTAMAVALRPRARQVCAALVAVDNSPWSTLLSATFPKYVKALEQIERAKLTKNSEAFEVLKKVEPNVVIQQFLMTNVKRVSSLPESAKRDLAEKMLKAEATNSPDADPVVDDAAIERLLHNDETKNVLHCRVPLDVIGKALDYMGDFPYLPMETRYNGPALFVRGSQSHYVPDEAIPLIGQLFPKFTMRDIDCGHWVISEKPHEFMDDFKDFVSKNVDPDE